jgi:hypothetical protein
VVKSRTGSNIERHRDGQRLDFVIWAALREFQNVLADLTGTGLGSRDSNACGVDGSVFAGRIVTMGHAVHFAHRLRHSHALTLCPAKLSGHLPHHQQKQEQERRHCRFASHLI